MFRRSILRACSVGATAVAGAGATSPASNRAPLIFKAPADAPVLEFLSSPKALVESVEPTIAACEGLMKALPKAQTPQEKHDILDSMSNVLCLLLDPCEFVRQIHPDAEYQNAAIEAFQSGNEWMCEANSRRELYDVLVEISEPKAFASLTEESRKNVVQLKRDMESNGIHLSDALRKKITQLNVEREHLAAEFLMKDRNPFGTLRNLVICRHELAQTLGFDCYADQQLRGCMLDTPQQVWHFLCAVGNKYRPSAELEVQRLRSHLGEVKSRGALTDEDRAKLSMSIRAQYENHGIEAYFSVANCIRGVQLLCENVFGIRLQPVEFEPSEHMSKFFKKFHCFDATTGSFIGVVILDMFARPSKHCQAGHLTVQLGCRPHNNALKHVGLQLAERQYPVVVLTCNAGSRGMGNRRPDGTYDEETTPMSEQEVTTFFHEFGHALHTLVGQTTVQNLAGTRTSIDYVECFSQFFEQFIRSHDFLKLWAHRIGTREPISADMVARSTEVHNMFRHLDTIDQVLLASIDQSLHGPQPFTVYFPTTGGQLGKRTLGTPQEYGRGIFNLAKLIIDMCNPISVVTPTERGVLRSLSFEHLAAYPAGYYGYLYSGAFAKRIYAKNFAANPLNRTEGERLVKEVMSLGAACDAKATMSAYLKEDINDIEAWI